MIKTETSPILDILVKKLSKIALEEETEFPSPIFRKSFGGPSWDFAGYRNYSPADDAKRIDWKASIRSNKVLIKEYTEIQTLNILFLLDISDSMLLGTTGKRKLDFASEVISTLSYSILKVKGTVRLALFSDSIKKFIISVNDIKQFYQITDTLEDENLPGGKANLQYISKMISPQLKKGTILILISDFLNLGDEWQDNITKLGSQVNIFTFMIRDPIDKSLPKGTNKVYIEEPSSGAKLLFNVRKYKKTYEEHSIKQELEIQNLINSVQGEFLSLDTSEPFLDKITDFLERREKKFR